MGTSREGDLTHRLADEYSRIIRDWLRPQELAEVLRRNKNLEPGACATHDFCDANVAMEDAFTIVLNHDFNPASIGDVTLWSSCRKLGMGAAWKRGRESNLSHDKG